MFNKALEYEKLHFIISYILINYIYYWDFNKTSTSTNIYLGVAHSIQNSGVQNVFFLDSHYYLSNVLLTMNSLQCYIKIIKSLYDEFHLNPI